MIKISTILLLILGILTLGTGAVSYFSGDLTKYSFSKSLDIDALFIFASEKINTFEQNYDHYPSKQDFENWREDFSRFNLYGKNIEYHLNFYPNEVLETFTQPTDEGFVLSLWRDEWHEFYVSWLNQSTLPKSISEYYMTGSRSLDLILSIIATIIIFSLALFLMKIKRITNQTRQDAASGATV